jgi:hypothetical protein
MFQVLEARNCLCTAFSVLLKCQDGVIYARVIGKAPAVGSENQSFTESGRVFVHMARRRGVLRRPRLDILNASCAAHLSHLV